MQKQSSIPSGTLIFHYHEKVFQDELGNLWLSSSQGIWLDELAKQFEKLYLFNFQTLKKSSKHDYRLSQNNIEWINLGINRGYSDFFKKRERLDTLCQEWSDKADYLLIRGFTPFQNKVWFRLRVKKSRSFLLVRSLKQPRLLNFRNPLSVIAYSFNRIQEFRFTKILNTADHLFTNSLEVRDELRKQFKEDAIFTTTNVLKAEDFQTFEFKPWNRDFHLLFVGRISALKGFKELIQAFCDLQDQNIGFNLTLHIAGDGEVTFVNQMKDILIKRTYLQKVIFYGRVSFGKDLFELYREAHAFVLPSYTEGFPRVLWEAALFSTPLVVTKVGGIPLVIQNLEHALLIEPRDPESLKDALDTLLHNKVAGHDRAKKAYELALMNTLESGVEELSTSIKEKK